MRGSRSLEKASEIWIGVERYRLRDVSGNTEILRYGQQNRQSADHNHASADDFAVGSESRKLWFSQLRRFPSSEPCSSLNLNSDVSGHRSKPVPHGDTLWQDSDDQPHHTPSPPQVVRIARGFPFLRSGITSVDPRVSIYRVSQTTTIVRHKITTLIRTMSTHHTVNSRQRSEVPAQAQWKTCDPNVAIQAQEIKTPFGHHARQDTAQQSGRDFPKKRERRGGSRK